MNICVYIIQQFKNCNKKERCVICYEYINNKNIITTKCNHYFCYSCISNWCDIKDSCPVCRYKCPLII